jgi:hypothetical protein
VWESVNAIAMDIRSQLMEEPEDGSKIVLANVRAPSLSRMA